MAPWPGTARRSRRHSGVGAALILDRLGPDAGSPVSRQEPNVVALPAAALKRRRRKRVGW